MNLYTIIFTGESKEFPSKAIVNVKAKNKVVAIEVAISKLRGWRDKDRITNIEITEDAGNRELTVDAYR